MMTLLSRALVLGFLLSASISYAGSADQIAPSDRVEPAPFAETWTKTPKEKRPLVLHVGFGWQYKSGHIPGAQHLGPGSEAPGLADLQKSLQGVSRDREIVIYCGCCPFHRCPNVFPALQTLRKMGFKNVRVLHIEKNFGDDWVNRKFPVER